MSILITGCSSGIGRETALYLKSQGYDVIATVRDDDSHAELEDDGVKVIHLEVNDSQSIRLAVEHALSIAENGIEVLINNAGFGQGGALEDISRDMLRAQFETNVFGLMELTNAVLPHMRESQKGLIINVSSMLGFVSLPFRGAYNASKHALESISDTLRLELSNTPIKVTLIEPGPIESNFRNTCTNKSLKNIDVGKSRFHHQYSHLVKQTRENQPILFKKEPIAVAKKILKIINTQNPKPRYQVTAATHLLFALKRLLTSRLLERVIKRVCKDELT